MSHTRWSENTLEAKTHTVWCLYKDKPTSRTCKHPELTLSMFNQPIFDNGAKNIKKRKTIYSTDSVEKVDICMEKNEIEPEPKNPL